jgi:cellobiose-specific phosphotransferase system component IIB
MKLSQIKEFFNEIITPFALKGSISNEMENVKASSAKKGGSTSIFLVEDISLIVEKSNIAILCQAYINSDLSEFEICYIVDALLLSSKVKFESEGLMELAETLTDPSVNGKLTKERVIEILNYCTK